MMIGTILNKLASGTREYQGIRNEVSEFRVLREEINKARCIIELNAKGEIIRGNDNLCQALGYQETELLGQHHRSLLARADAGSAEYEQFWTGLRNAKSQVGAFKLVSKDGKEAWLQGYYAPVCDGPNGNLRKVVAYLTDITRDKQSLLASASEAQGVNSVFTVSTIGLDGRILEMNEAFLNVLGYQHGEIIGQPLDKLMTVEDRGNPEWLAFWESVKRGESKSRQIRRVAKDGRNLWFMGAFFPIMDAQGTVVFLKSYGVCITDLKNSFANFEAQISAVHDHQGVIEFDLQGNILAVNDNFAQATGYGANEVIGKHHSMFVTDEYKHSPEYKAFWDNLRSGVANNGLFHRKGRGGKDLWLQASYFPIHDVDGKYYKVVKFAIDVTTEITEREAQAKKVAEAFMIQTTLDSASTNMMMADNDGVIRYMNASTERLMQGAASNMRKVLPHFDPAKIIGQNFDIFHKNPAHQRGLLASLSKEYTTEIPVGDLFMRLKATPIFDRDGKRSGTSLEWQDITQERKVSEQIATIIANAANGDLSERIDLSDKSGVTVEICQGVNNLLDKMTEVLLQVREAGETINTAAQEISTGNNDLSSRTEQQASSLEETASSMEELASTVKQNAENAKQANQMAEAASQVAIRGGQVVGNVVTTMSAINESARKIEDIITVIDGIAFQTNILALNAAVEAARAGEQGRGFAVVAGEVRNLAQRSASAAKEIKELITDSVNKTAEGTKLVESAGATMNEVVTSVQRVTDIMSEISAASVEQSSGINQVNDAITNMDEVTQQNAALVEEAAAAAESLVEQASNLMDSVNSFRLHGVSQSSATRKSGTPARAVSQRPAAAHAAYASKPVAAAAYHAPKKMAKTGTDDGDWEEF